MGTWCGARTALWSWTTGSDCLHKRSRQEWGPGACELHGEALSMFRVTGRPGRIERSKDHQQLYPVQVLFTWSTFDNSERSCTVSDLLLEELLSTNPGSACDAWPLSLGSCPNVSSQ
ncbi:hypothetical protein RRG08_027614 [Elysia crispata]|uniref:Uncharacterized protein n=1 Tax=Elysia crispata TaxID=231223 RepID=A0AAE1DYW4_9GAST|nr:hypothetical protein RRG08_027614 [Elysia crispata]